MTPLSFLICPEMSATCARALPKPLQSIPHLRRMPRRVNSLASQGRPARAPLGTVGSLAPAQRRSSRSHSQPLSMLMGPLYKGEPASQKQGDDFETVTLNRLLLKVRCAEPMWNGGWKVRSPWLGGYDPVWRLLLGLTAHAGTGTMCQHRDRLRLFAGSPRASPPARPAGAFLFVQRPEQPWQGGCHLCSEPMEHSSGWVFKANARP